MNRNHKKKTMKRAISFHACYSMLVLLQYHTALALIVKPSSRIKISKSQSRLLLPQVDRNAPKNNCYFHSQTTSNVFDSIFVSTYSSSLTTTQFLATFGNNGQESEAKTYTYESTRIVTDPIPSPSQKRKESNLKRDSRTKNTTMNRRLAFQKCLSGVSLTYIAATTASLPSNAATLEELKLGKGIWNDNNGSSQTSSFSSSNNNNFDGSLIMMSLPPSFSNYACRFLIKYDPAVRSWWEDQILATHIKSSTTAYISEDEKKRITEDFTSLMGVVQNAIVQFILDKRKIDDEHAGFQQLIQIFTSKYGTTGVVNNDDDSAERHIAILFALLPPEMQPKRELERLNIILTKTLSNKEGQQRQQQSQDLYALLPKPYSITYSLTSNSFSLTPELVPPFDDIYSMNSPISPIPVSIAGDSTSASTLTESLSESAAAAQTLNSNALTNLKPLTRSRPTYTPTIYALLGAAGGLGCALTHTVVVPLDVVKTRMQTDPLLSNNNNDDHTTRQKQSMIQSASAILEKEGVSGLLLGLQATIIGYLWYGISVYPSYTFFKRFLLFQSANLAIPFGFGLGDANMEELISLAAGAMSAVLASLGLTPLEACRIRAVADPQTYAPMGVTGTAAVIASENPGLGWTNLYAGLPSLLTRQVVFGSVKFLAFEKASAALLTVLPTELTSNPGSMGSLTVSLLAGGFAGCLSSVVSQPADCVLTYVAQNSSSSKALGVLEGCRIMVSEGGVGTLFRGLGSRCVWAGSIIAGQFLLYDVFRAMLGVDTESLKQVFQIVIDS